MLVTLMLATAVAAAVQTVTMHPILQVLQAAGSLLTPGAAAPHLQPTVHLSPVPCQMTTQTALLPTSVSHLQHQQHLPSLL